MSFLLYDLKTRLGIDDLATCSALTASASRAQHFNALAQLEKILGVRCFDSPAEFADWLRPGAESALPHHPLGFEPRIGGADVRAALRRHGPRHHRPPVPGQHPGGPGADLGRLLRSPGLASGESGRAGPRPGASRGQARPEPCYRAGAGRLRANRGRARQQRPQRPRLRRPGRPRWPQILLRRHGPRPGPDAAVDVRRPRANAPHHLRRAEPHSKTCSARSTQRPATSACRCSSTISSLPGSDRRSGRASPPSPPTRARKCSDSPGGYRCPTSAGSTRTSWPVTRCRCGDYHYVAYVHGDLNAANILVDAHRQRLGHRLLPRRARARAEGPGQVRERPALPAHAHRGRLPAPGGPRRSPAPSARSPTCKPRFPTAPARCAPPSSPGRGRCSRCCAGSAASSAMRTATPCSSRWRSCVTPSTRSAFPRRPRSRSSRRWRRRARSPSRSPGPSKPSWSCGWTGSNPISSGQAGSASPSAPDGGIGSATWTRIWPSSGPQAVTRLLCLLTDASSAGRAYPTSAPGPRPPASTYRRLPVPDQGTPGCRRRHRPRAVVPRGHRSRRVGRGDLHGRPRPERDHCRVLPGGRAGSRPTRPSPRSGRRAGRARSRPAPRKTS